MDQQPATSEQWGVQYYDNNKNRLRWMPAVFGSEEEAEEFIDQHGYDRKARFNDQDFDGVTHWYQASIIE